MTSPSTTTGTRPLGRTGLQVSPITLGTSYLGNPAQPDGQPAAEAAALADALLHAPYTVIDTSNGYADGRSETVLGQAIARHGLEPGRLIITKVDADPATGQLDRDRVWRSFEESRRRLGLDTLALLHLHDPYTISVADAFAPDGAVAGMIELRAQGLVQAIGIAAGPIALMTDYVSSGIFDALLTHNRYTIVDQRAEQLMSLAHSHGMGVFNAAPFGGGLLTGRGTRYAYRESPPALRTWVERAEALCRDWSVTLPAVALHHSLRSPLIHSTVVGVNQPHRIAELAELHSTPVPDAFWSALAALGTPPSTVVD